MSTLVRSALSSLPHGRTLSDEAWSQRHRWMLWLLWGNVAGLFAFGLAQGEATLHVALDAGVIALLAAAGVARRRDRRSGSAAVALGLLTSSAVAVHLSHGAIEAHFHFFVVIAALSLYEDWLPFGLAAGFVLLHHALLGTLVPQAVFSHEGAIAHPWRWALVHAAFVAAAGGVNVLAWRLHEDTRGRLRGLATIVESSHDAILSLDTAGQLLSWNGGASRVFGFADDEVLGRHIEVLLVDDHADGDARMLERLLHGEHVQEHESVWRDRSGARIDVRLSASPLRDAHGMVTGASAIVQDVTERRRAAEELRSSREALAHQAMHDALTGLPNRLLLHDRLEKALQRARRTGGRVALLFLDVDRFKVVNDSLGHAAGDDLLVRMAARLDEAVRASDTLARFGGDELAILCEDLEHERGAVEVAERVVAALASPIVIDGREVLATASVGVALSDCGETDADALLRDADAAMYRAKELGGARYELFDADMRARSLERMQIDHELRLAIGRGELRLHFQPVVALEDGTAIGAEALVRWQHPTRGLLAPGAFVPIAEESALIVALGEWVLGDACRQLAEWEPLLPEGFVLAVNVSARQFAEPAFVDVVRSALDEAGASASRLAIELTESSLMQQEGSEDVLRALRALGVRLVMDDFGTGYSSLSYLSRFELDGLKIDRSFVAKMTDGSPEHAIIAAVGTMAGAMDLHVVAEGVETAGQQEALSRLGYRYAQGFLFARPMDAGAFADVLHGCAADQTVAG